MADPKSRFVPASALTEHVLAVAAKLSETTANLNNPVTMVEPVKALADLIRAAKEAGLIDHAK